MEPLLVGACLVAAVGFTVRRLLRQAKAFRPHAHSDCGCGRGRDCGSNR